MLKSFTVRVAFLVGAVALAVPVVADAQQFIAYEGKNTIHEGDGGAKKVVDGVDFWSDGAPPRRYQIVGFINDRRHKSGLFGAISMSGLDKDVASVAKQNGGDAVILVQSEAETVSAVAASNGQPGFAFGAAHRVQKQNSKFAVVKYLPDLPAHAQPSASSTAAGTSDGPVPAPTLAPNTQPAASQ